jgi:hypothetical protein
MKILADKTEVPDRTYYYLLDWNEVNEREYIFGKIRLADLNFSEYKQLFEYATKSEFE